MCTVVVTYEPNNEMAQGLMNLLAMTEGVEIDDDAILTDEELRRIDESRKSGYASLDELKQILRR
jgi:hypothetical protein